MNTNFKAIAPAFHETVSDFQFHGMRFSQYFLVTGAIVAGSSLFFFYFSDLCAEYFLMENRVEKLNQLLDDVSVADLSREELTVYERYVGHCTGMEKAISYARKVVSMFTDQVQHLSNHSVREWSDDDLTSAYDEFCDQVTSLDDVCEFADIA